MNRRLLVSFVALTALLDRSALADETPAPPAPAPPLVQVPVPVPDPEAPPESHPVASIVSIAAIYVPLTVWSYFAWYHDVADLPAFKFGGDGYFGPKTYAGGADKLGHFWVNLALSRGTTEILRWGGYSRLKSAIWASSLSFAFFFFVEIKDGFYYQFSPGDLIGNGLGAATSAAMVLFPRFDELVDFRMQYFPSRRFRPELADGNVDVAEDYSGQTFQVALHLGALPGVKGEQLGDYLRFVDFAVGFHAENYRPYPKPDEAFDRSQELFVGLSLNVQGIIDASLSGGWRKLGHGMFEVWQLPYTTLPVARASRSVADPPPPGALTTTVR